MAMIGYARVFPFDPGDVPALAAFCDKVFVDTTPEHPELDRCLATLQPGDTLVIPRLATMARNTRHLLHIVTGPDSIASRDVSLIVLSMCGRRVDTRTRQGGTFFDVLAGLAEMLRDLKSESHLAAVADAGPADRGGRPAVHDAEAIAVRAREMDAELDENGKHKYTKAEIAEALGISSSTLYRALNPDQYDAYNQGRRRRPLGGETK